MALELVADVSNAPHALDHRRHEPVRLVRQDGAPERHGAFVHLDPDGMRVRRMSAEPGPDAFREHVVGRRVLMQVTGRPRRKPTASIREVP